MLVLVVIVTCSITSLDQCRLELWIWRRTAVQIETGEEVVQVSLRHYCLPARRMDCLFLGWQVRRRQTKSAAVLPKVHYQYHQNLVSYKQLFLPIAGRYSCPCRPPREWLVPVPTCVVLLSPCFSSVLAQKPFADQTPRVPGLEFSSGRCCLPDLTRHLLYSALTMRYSVAAALDSAQTASVLFFPAWRPHQTFSRPLLVSACPFSTFSFP